MSTKVSIDISTVEQPEQLTREQRQILQRDRLMDKMEYCSDIVHADFEEKLDAALCCIRKCYAWLEGLSPLPDHLKPVKEYIYPIIREYGADPSGTGEVSNDKGAKEDA